MDIQMELTQGAAASQMVALFTFVARNVKDGRSHPVNPLRPETKSDQELFCSRQRVADARKAARAKAKETGVQCEQSADAWPDARSGELRRFGNRAGEC